MPFFRVEKQKNYTVLANLILFDKTLSFKAKGLLATMLACSDKWDFTLKGLSKLSDDGIESVRTGLKELEKHKYLKRERIRNDKGHFTDTEYFIYEVPYDQRDDTESIEFQGRNGSGNREPSPECENPTLDNPTLDNPISDMPISEKEIQSNTNQLNTNILKNQSINHSKCDRRIEELEKEIKSRIEYSIIVEGMDESEVKNLDGLVAHMIEVEYTCESASQYKIGKDTYPAKLVLQRYRSIKSTEIQYVIEALSKNTTKIHSIGAYIKKSLFNASVTVDSYYQAEVQHDMYGKAGRK